MSNERVISSLSCRWVVFEEPGFCGESYILEKGLYGSPEDWGGTLPTITSAMPVVLVNIAGWIMNRALFFCPVCVIADNNFNSSIFFSRLYLSEFTSSVYRLSVAFMHFDTIELCTKSKAEVLKVPPTVHVNLISLWTREHVCHKTETSWCVSHGEVVLVTAEGKTERS